MKKLAQVLPFVAMVLAPSSFAWADPVTITFEAPPCTAIAPGIYPWDCYVGAGVALLRSQNSEVPAVQFPGFMISADANAVSPPNVARPITGFNTLYGEFRDATGHFGVGSVSFNIVGSLLGQPPWGAEFFSTEGLLARFSGFDDRLLEFVGGGPRSILGFRFFPGGSARALDNLSFNGAQAAVPEPATVLLTASGILALARRRWLTTRPRRSAD